MRQRDVESNVEVPGAGWAVDRRRLLLVGELPVWYEPLSKYVLGGYRPPSLGFCACTATLCDVHNETGNIWTHLIGGGVWAAVSLNSLRSPDLAIRADGETGCEQVQLGNGRLVLE